MDTEYINISELQPSQLYLSDKKLKSVEKYISSIDIDQIEPLPVKEIGDITFLTDGHTRAYLLNKRKKVIKVYQDQDELDWFSYMVCISWAKKNGIEKVEDLETRIIDHNSYKKLWLDRCKSMHKKMKDDLFNFVDFKVINEPGQKSDICFNIINNLNDWFGNEDANRGYSRGVREEYFLSAQVGDIPIGFISVKNHNQFTGEIYVLGILEEFHNKGIGRDLIEIASEQLVKENKRFLTVKTLSSSNPDKYYKKTRVFYRKMGFYPLEEMPELWSEEEPCLFMVKVLS